MSKISFNNFPAVVLVVNKKTQLSFKNGKYYLNAKALKDRKVDTVHDICPNNKIADKSSAFSEGSGFFIGKNIIATAGHVILGANKYESSSLEDLVFISNFVSPKVVDGRFEIEPKDIFEPLESTLREDCFDYSSTGEDWALIPVKSLVNGTERTPILPGKDHMQPEEVVACIGHPLGLTIADAQIPIGNILKVKDKNVFETQIGVFAGNSGSPIINESGHVIGIVIRGTGDILLTENTNDDDACIKFAKEFSLFQGEESQRINIVIRTALDNLNEDKTISTEMSALT